ncbi:hypothetical protein COCCADRAFT_93088, partial [Bipolaris zeicola 26-R-13]
DLLHERSYTVIDIQKPHAVVTIYKHAPFLSIEQRVTQRQCIWAKTMMEVPTPIHTFASTHMRLVVCCRIASKAKTLYCQ